MKDHPTQRVMITGAAGNLGSAVARAFQQAGARLILLDHKPGRLEKLYPELTEGNDHVLAGGIDLTDAAQVQEGVNSAVETLGGIEVLVHTVGGFRMGSPVHEISPDTWDLMMNLNVKTLRTMSRAVVPHMLDREAGKIITIGARPALGGRPRMGAYGAAKSAVLRLTESMAAELKSSGINANCVLPGTIDTPENREAMPKADFEKWVQPESLADVILFLASSASRDIHGAAVPVYGRS